MTTSRKRQLAIAFANLEVWTPTQRAELLRRTSTISSPTGVEIGSGFQLEGTGILKVGPSVFINRNFYAEVGATIHLHEGVSISDHVRILTSTHDLGPASKRAGALTTGEVTVESGAWLGSGVLVLPGVTIGEGAVVGAGAVVLSDCRPNTVYAGVPAVALRKIHDPIRTTTAPTPSGRS